MQQILVQQRTQIADHLPAVGDHHRDVHTTTRRGSCPPRRDRRPASAVENAPVKPLRSASSRNSAVPACDTTPAPSTVTTGNGRPDLVAFTQKVPLRAVILDLQQAQFPAQSRHFPHLQPRVDPPLMNQPG